MLNADTPKDIHPQAGDIARVHFIGIAGSGMAGIALVAHLRGLRVSGSDLRESSYVQPLLAAGVDVRFGHSADALCYDDIDVVVVSTAIPKSNPELQEAQRRGIPVWPRARMLAWLGAGSKLLAVSGTHGKTTTSSMLATTLMSLGADPTFLIGGVVKSVDASAHAGSGELFVVEADESDGSFTWLDPLLSVITNIEADHLDHYEGLPEIQEAFRSFLAKLRPGGVAVVCADDEGLVALAREQGRAVLTYGLHQSADVRVELQGNLEFTAVFADGERVSLRLAGSPGIHNMLNATAVLCALDWLGFNRQEAASALEGFGGVQRRFDIKGEACSVTVIDDYGHHPTEVGATILAARRAGYNGVHVLFQPHRYTRTRAFMQDFAEALIEASSVSLMPIYPAGEEPIEGVSSEALLEAINAQNGSKGPSFARLLPDRDSVCEAMADIAAPGDCILCMGAGDVTKEAPAVLHALQAREAAGQCGCQTGEEADA